VSTKDSNDLDTRRRKAFTAKVPAPRDVSHQISPSWDPRHGKLWQTERLRIAKLGAPTRGEALIYRSANKTFSKDFLIAEAEDHGFELSTMPCKEYRQQIGYKYGLIDKSGEGESKSATDLLRKVRSAFLKGERRKKQVEVARLARNLKSKAVHLATVHQASCDPRKKLADILRWLSFKSAIEPLPFCILVVGPRQAHW
jgi:hypothetical protein